MNITIIYGQKHQGNTYNLSQLFLKHLVDSTSQVTEFFLPETDLGYCVGCENCFMKDEKICLHATTVQKIAKALDCADLIIIASACYVFGMTGQLKVLFDHFGYRFMAHRPEAAMFHKKALVLTTAAGAGMNRVNKAVAFNLFMWGIARVYSYGLRIGAESFEKIPLKRQEKIKRAVRRMANRILKDKVAVGLKTRVMFYFMRLNQKRNDWSEVDKAYWEKQGWLGKTKPY